MKSKKIFLLTISIASLLPITSHADVQLTNNTNEYATGRLNSSPCSSSIGERGIVPPNSQISVPYAVLPLYCGVFSNCEAYVFMNKDCSGKAVAKATINAVKGTIESFKNLDPEHYTISANGKTGSINPGPQPVQHKKKWLDFIFSL